MPAIATIVYPGSRIGVKHNLRSPTIPKDIELGGEHMSPAYSYRELSALGLLVAKYGHLTYAYPRQLAAEFTTLTGTHRSHGALYMASWRLENGYYDHMLSRDSIA